MAEKFIGTDKMFDSYFAAEQNPEKTVAYLKKKSDSWYNTLYANRYIDKLRRSWLAYHGSYYGSDYGDSHTITFGGESGELTNLAVNHYRNIATNILTMITASRPAFQARSANTDYKSQAQTILANGLLDYYMREKRLEKYLKTSVEYAVVMGSGFIKMEWNATSGKIYDYIDPREEDIVEYDENDNPLDKDGNILKSFPVYEGDVEFTNLSPFDIFCDGTKESAIDNEWIVCRSFKNKYDLIAKYPEHSDKIKALKTKSDLQKKNIDTASFDETDDVPVYEFFHKKTESLPDGRYILYLSEDVVLIDTVMPYRNLPIFRMSAGEILGTPYGYTPMFDLLPIQDAVNSLHSTILTNNNAFGVQSILNPRGNDIRVTQISSGMNFIDYNPVVPGGVSGKPEALQLTHTAAETFNYLGMLEREMEIISGVNSVVRGNPESSLKSGNALALIQTQALQFVSGLQQSYIMLLEDVGTNLIQLLQDFAQVPRIAAIAGESNKTKMREFSSDDLLHVNRVVVDIGNPLSHSTAGKVQMADNLLQMGLIQTPEQYFNVINTGNIQTMTEGQTNEMLLIKAENERLTDGTSEVLAIATDKHSIHIKEHMNVLADPDLRQDGELVARVNEHILAHINLLRTTDPSLLALRGEQPLGPVAGSPIAPGSAPMTDVNQQGMQQNAPLMEQPLQASPNANLPQPAQPATIEGAPANAEEAFLRNSQ